MFRTIERIYGLAPLYTQFNITIPFPGTELWKWMDAKKILPNEFKWNYYQMSNIEGEKLTEENVGNLPIYVPDGFTKMDIVELFKIANHIGIWNEFRYKFKNAKIKFMLSAGRHPVRFIKGITSLIRYKIFKNRIISKIGSVVKEEA